MSTPLQSLPMQQTGSKEPLLFFFDLNRSGKFIIYFYSNIDMASWQCILLLLTTWNITGGNNSLTRCIWQRNSVKGEWTIDLFEYFKKINEQTFVKFKISSRSCILWSVRHESDETDAISVCLKEQCRPLLFEVFVIMRVGKYGPICLY